MTGNDADVLVAAVIGVLCLVALGVTLVVSWLEAHEDDMPDAVRREARP